MSYARAKKRYFLRLMINMWLQEGEIVNILLTLQKYEKLTYL